MRWLGRLVMAASLTLCSGFARHLRLRTGSTWRQFAVGQAHMPSKPRDTPHQPISWYPGHIAKAERELVDYLKKVDVVIEVIDARIPFATTHPMVPTWVNNKPLIVAVGRIDQISKSALREWRAFFARNRVHPERPDAKVYFVNGQTGDGVMTLRQAAIELGKSVNERRERKGIKPRAIRAAVIGYPNVGKSAVINRLLQKRMAKSQNLPGVTRSLQWVRLGGPKGSQENAIELLDSPGIIPARQFHQDSALKLAICNDIGEASYDRVIVAAEMIDQVVDLQRQRPAYVDLDAMNKRYKMDVRQVSGEFLLNHIADTICQGNRISAADRLLSDFRKERYSFCSLEAPPLGSFFLGKEAVLADPVSNEGIFLNDQEHQDESLQGEDPPLDEEDGNSFDAGQDSTRQSPLLLPSEIGKGKFDGW